MIRNELVEGTVYENVTIDGKSVERVLYLGKVPHNLTPNNLVVFRTKIKTVKSWRFPNYLPDNSPAYVLNQFGLEIKKGRERPLSPLEKEYLNRKLMLKGL